MGLQPDLVEIVVAEKVNMAGKAYMMVVVDTF
jgi:hypothetical protein